MSVQVWPSATLRRRLRGWPPSSSFPRRVTDAVRWFLRPHNGAWRPFPLRATGINFATAMFVQHSTSEAVMKGGAIPCSRISDVTTTDRRGRFDGFHLVISKAATMTMKA
jgi:hypothetical protein